MEVSGHEEDDDTRLWDPDLVKAIVEATKEKNIKKISALLSNREDQKRYGILVAEIAAENGHLEIFDLLRTYGIINVGDALERAGGCASVCVCVSLCICVCLCVFVSVSGKILLISN